MPGPRDYSAGTRAALAALSRGGCYFPGCDSRIIRFVDGEPYIDYQIAHIRDAKPGNRYDGNMSADERRAFANLVLLCKPHHELVDKRHPERYSTSDLTAWKHEREGESLDGLAGIGPVDEDDLASLIEEAAFSITNSNINLGGTGGSAPGAGGGGGGAMGGGRAGDGGPGGDVRISMDGLPGTAPGAGGGGRGTDDPGGFAGDGGGGGEHVTQTLAVSEGDVFTLNVSQGGESGHDGGDTWVEVHSPDGELKHRILAHGGKAGLSGSAKRDLAEGPALDISSAFLASSAYYDSNGLTHVLGAGMKVFTVKTIPSDMSVLLVLLAEPRQAGERDTELSIGLRDPGGSTVLSEQRQHSFNVTSVAETMPFFVPLGPFTASQPGLWSIVVESGAEVLATVRFELRLDSTSIGPSTQDQP